MSESLGMKVVNRVEKADRFPFIKALAHLATVDDSVDLDEKAMVNEYAEAWELDEQEKADVQSILNTEQRISVRDLAEEFTESNTRFLLVQELMRLSYADGTYGKAERKEIAAIAQRMEMSEQQFREVEKWVGRGQAWEEEARDTDEEDGSGALEEVLDDEGDEDEGYDLSDIQTADSDLEDIDPGGYDVGDEELDDLLGEEEEADEPNGDDTTKE